MTGLVELLPLAVALLVIGLREAGLIHRRSRMNQALHEARRPLQAIALSLPAGPGRLTPALPVSPPWPRCGRAPDSSPSLLPLTH